MQAFNPGIERAGYKALRIDAKEFAGDIHDEALAEIRKSRIVVVDLTGERQNVDYEAGFAEGLGLPVVYTAKEGTKLHFDVRQRNCIMWTDDADLGNLLKARLEALFGRGPVAG
jgi:nucleoside 2-deoxyribosyltransferase